ncbi:MAG: hypothetical protein LBF59_06010, partial [Prevotellaceae bacterium]|nr:hypothetical protein [Prevotellaceae bacterium]
MKLYLILPFLGLMILGKLQAQQKTTLTIEQAVNIALHESYTVQSNDENRKAMQFSYLYYKA